MVEIIDNAVQLAVTLACTGVCGCLTLKRRKQAYTILTCYYGALAMKPTAFDPAGSCTRAQLVTFLWRYFSK